MLARDIIAACQRNLLEFSNDCSGFVRAVADECGVLLTGDANEIVDTLAGSSYPLADGVAAATAARRGDLVVGGVKASGHGHVVVVVDGPVRNNKYPYAFWGQYHGVVFKDATLNAGFTRGHGTVNWAYDRTARDQIVYAAFPVSRLLLEPARGSQGYLSYTFT